MEAFIAKLSQVNGDTTKATLPPFTIEELWVLFAGRQTKLGYFWKAAVCWCEDPSTGPGTGPHTTRPLAGPPRPGLPVAPGRPSGAATPPRPTVIMGRATATYVQGTHSRRDGGTPHRALPGG